MQLRYLISLMFLLAACGPNEYVVVQPEPSPSATPSFERYHLLPNSGYVDIYQDAQGMVTIRGARVQSTNSDGSMGLLPLSTSSALAVAGGIATLNASQAYVTATHNVKPDTGGAALNGSFTTVYLFSLTADRELLLKITIYSGPSVVYTRTIIGSKP